MTEVKRPVLLDANLNDESILHPTKGTLDFNMDSPNEATLTLEDKAETIPMHRWVRMYNHLGFAGIFRRTSRGRNIGNDNSYTLKHGIDILQDSIWDAETTFTGTKTEFLTALLNKQTHLIQGPGDSEPRKPWALGTCADTSSMTKDIKYDNLLELLESLNEEGGAYYFTYDQTVWPWTVSLAAKPVDVESEFRLDRNMERCQIKDNDSEMCTRLLLNVNKMVTDTSHGVDIDQNVSTYRTYNNTTAQASYGIIVKTEDIDVSSDTEADAWAADYLARRAEPQLQVEVDGYLLKDITGDSWDESKVATMVRVALPDYATAITERCIRVRYTDLYGTPDRVSVSLANALPTFTRSMKATQKSVTSQARSGRGSSRQAKSFEQHFKITDKNDKVLQQAGMKLDANGLLVYAEDNENMVGSKFHVQADRIGMVVGHNENGNFIKAAEIAIAINDNGSEAYINADHIYIDATDDIKLSDFITAANGYFVVNGQIQVINGDIVIQYLGGLASVSSAIGNILLEDNQNGTYTLKQRVLTGTQYTTIGTFNRGGSASDILLGDADSTSSRPSGTAKNGWRSDILDAINNRKYFKFKGTIDGGSGEQWFYIDFS